MKRVGLLGLLLALLLVAPAHAKPSKWLSYERAVMAVEGKAAGVVTCKRLGPRQFNCRSSAELIAHEEGKSFYIGQRICRHRVILRAVVRQRTLGCELPNAFWDWIYEPYTEEELPTEGQEIVLVPSLPPGVYP